MFYVVRKKYREEKFYLSILCVPKNGRRGSLSVLCNSTVRGEPVLRRLRITPSVFCLAGLMGTKYL